MKYINDNKSLLIKYGLIIIFNIIIYILCNYYFKSSDTGYVIMLFVVFIFNLFIYNYKGQVLFKYHLDIICNLIVGIILLLFIKNNYSYIVVTFSLFLSNNIVFMKSRISDKILLRSIQYLLILLLTFLSTFISLSLFYLIY